MNPKAIVAAIEADVLAERVFPKDVREWNRASSLGWATECLTHLVRKRLMPEQEVISSEQRFAMREGELQEKLMRDELALYAPAKGFDVVKARPMLSTEYEIMGTMDDELVAKEGLDRYALDYKSASPYVYKTVVTTPTMKGLMASQFPWIRHYPAQILTYSMLTGIPKGVLYFKNKVSGKKCLVEVDAREWTTYTMEILAAVRVVNQHVKLGTFPVYKEIDVCRKCGFFQNCWPDTPTAKEPLLVTDAEIIMTVARISELEWAVKEHKKLLEEIKPSLQELGERAIIGDFIVTNKSYQTTVYPNMPAEVKAKYAEKKDVIRTDIKRLTEGL